MGNKDAGMIPECSVKVYDITPADEVLLICSDGIWTLVSCEEALNIVGEFSSSQAAAAAEKLATEARNRWHQASKVVDDITALVIYLSPVGGTSEQERCTSRTSRTSLSL
mmetsp:Transcript_91917/g.160793  ORF Transcript_91917/g.160793 Transcript_91917/m.160793 type:complete len:110 (+) Transcript_91917:1012-1341(+)